MALKLAPALAERDQVAQRRLQACCGAEGHGRYGDHHRPPLLLCHPCFVTLNGHD
ncbi:hypothetical protein [Synechococcus sp. M16.1]|uniref:hypothetical protein n=1 Tax=Synechococcus sp. M16.1 TaxID=1442553 RepID=UPI001647D702|nr:hypothetical protein [Synechococcus sp. M16.1]